MMSGPGIRTIGLVLVAAILAAATFLVALPLYTQSLDIDAATAALARANDEERSEVAALAEQRADLAGVDRQITELRAQIPDSADLLSVTQLVGTAAAATRVTVVSFTPGDSIAVETGLDTAMGPARRVPLEMSVTAPSIDNVMAFLDALRAGPRLIRDIAPSVSTRTGAVQATITADVYVYSEPSR